MPNIGTWHPQIVHFVIALGLVGVLLRLGSLIWRNSWINPAACALILSAAGASVLAAKSGDDAHGPAERIPGAREAVQTHEHWGHRTRNILLALAGIEILALLFRSKKAGPAFHYLSAAGGVGAAYAVVVTSDLGGKLVYEYAGGVGTRSGEPGDITNLLVAGLYHAARAARDSGKLDVSARLIDELHMSRQQDTSVWLLVAESKLRDLKDGAAALVDLSTFEIPEGNRLETRYGLLRAEAFAALGRNDSARVVLQALESRFPQNRAIKDALAKLP